MMWNLQSYLTTVLNEKCNILGGQNILWSLLHIFRGSRPIQLPWSTSLTGRASPGRVWEGTASRWSAERDVAAPWGSVGQLAYQHQQHVRPVHQPTCTEARTIRKTSLFFTNCYHSQLKYTVEPLCPHRYLILLHSIPGEPKKYPPKEFS